MDNGINTELQNGEQTNTLKDYIRLLWNNWLPVFLIILTGLVVAIIYAVNATDIYQATSMLKISKQKGRSEEHTSELQSH